jgi:formate hydrogenlyase transcriptional activator
MNWRKRMNVLQEGKAATGGPAETSSLRGIYLPGELGRFSIHDMTTDTNIPAGADQQRYEAVLRISEAIAACREPEELARTLADGLGEFLHFDNLYVMILKENSTEIETMVWGKGTLPLPDLPIEELPTWEAFDSQQPLYIFDWTSEHRFPRVKAWLTQTGVKSASSVTVPLTTPHRRLGTFGICCDTVTPYSEEDVSFLRLIGRVVAFAIDDGLNLRRAQEAQACLQNQNERLQLLLNLTNSITSNLNLREVLPAITANIREVMRCDAVGLTLPDPPSGKFRLYAVDFPQGKGTGVLQEETVVTPTAAAKRALENLTPVITNTDNRDDYPPEVYELLVAEGLRNHCLLPLVIHGRALGLLVVIRKTESFMDHDVEILSQAAGQIAIAVENALAYREISDLKDKLAQEKLYLQEEIRSEMGFEQLVGNSATLRHVLELVETVAPSDSTVLLLGETGTGKELIARAIHEHSRRKDRTFVKLNCAAIPTGLLESELFGHEKGAFTGAISQKIGRLELADQGTLFLDEVGDVPLEIQPKLLRVLQEREFERLGSIHTRRVNVRLVAATNRDLEKMIADREFRMDLFYRLNVFPIRIPPLRDRKEDIPLLVTYFVQKFAKQMQKNITSIPALVMKELNAWEWPGNIRELENFVERSVILSRGASLDPPIAELRKTQRDEPRPKPQPANGDIARIVKETLDSLNTKKTVDDEHARIQREEIIHALTESKGRVGGADGAAARMGINRTTLLSRMRKFGIDSRKYA